MQLDSEDSPSLIGYRRSPELIDSGPLERGILEWNRWIRWWSDTLGLHEITPVLVAQILGTDPVTLRRVKKYLADELHAALSQTGVAILPNGTILWTCTEAEQRSLTREDILSKLPF